MRVLVVDRDSLLLTEITQLLGEYFAIDAVTTKADCLDLIRANEFDVIVACERLEDGSGLELLGHLAHSRPDMLRIFAAEPGRLQLLKGRLRPFGLFRTLSYPIEPRQMLAALSAAAGIEEQIEEAEAPAEETPPPRQSEPEPVAVLAPTPVRVVSHARAGTHARTEAPASSRPRVPTQPHPQARPQPGHARASNPQWHRSRQPTAAAVAAASRLDIVPRPKGYPQSAQSSPARSAFLVAAGVLLVLGGLWLSFKIFDTRDNVIAADLAATHTSGYPPEVVKLVGDTEVAFQQGNLRTVRTDVAALQQIAPDHPRLPFLVSLLKKLEASSSESTASRDSLARRLFQRPTSPPAPERSRTDFAPVAAANRTTSGPARPAPSVSTFRGRTLEDDSFYLNDRQPTTTLPPGATLPSDTAPTREARILQRVSPDYPVEAERHRIEGLVDLSFTVDPEGKVTDVIVIHSEPSDVFDRAAATAVRHWRYEPRLLSGTPVEEHMKIRLQFKLDSIRQ